MSKLLNKFGKSYKVNLSNKGDGVNKDQKFVKVVCERPYISIVMPDLGFQ